MNTPTAQLPFTTQTAATTTSTRSPAMSELSLVPNGDNAITMTSREIAELTGKELAHVHRDIRAMLDELKKDDPNLDHPLEDKDSRGYTTCFHLNRELTETLLTGYSASARLKVIRRWHDLEEQISTRQAFAIPQSYTEALRLAADLAEGKAKAELEVAQKQKLLEVAAPKAEAFDAISASTETMTITQAAKILSKKRKDLIQRLHAEHWIYPQNGSWLAYDPHIRSGYLVYKEAKYTDDQTGMEKHKPYCHVTPKGLAKMALMLGQTPQPRGMA